MVAKYRCTKIVTGPASDSDPANRSLLFTYVDPTVNPPAVYTNATDIPYRDAEDPVEIRANIDNLVSSDTGGDTIDWTL